MASGVQGGLAGQPWNVNRLLGRPLLAGKWGRGQEEPGQSSSTQHKNSDSSASLNSGWEPPTALCKVGENGKGRKRTEQGAIS